MSKYKIVLEIIIQFITLIKDSLIHPEKLAQALTLKKGKVVLFFPLSKAFVKCKGK